MRSRFDQSQNGKAKTLSATPHYSSVYHEVILLLCADLQIFTLLCVAAKHKHPNLPSSLLRVNSRDF